MRIPFFGVAREYAEHREEFLAAADAALAHGKALQGPEVEQFEARLATLCRRRHAVAVNSATDGLYFALAALGVRPGDEVLVPDFSFVASASCVLRAGATPVFVDVGRDGNMLLGEARRKVTARTRAILAVHLYGRMMSPASLEALVRETGLPLVEDAAQAIGAVEGGRPAGSVGSVSCISFDPTKVIGANGSGGMVLTDDLALATALRRLRYHGKNEAGEFESLGYNSQMPSLIASLLLRKLDRLDAWYRRRLTIAETYHDGLKGVPGLEAPEVPADGSHIFHKYVVRSRARDELQRGLDAAGIQTMVHYPKPLHAQGCFSHLRNGEDGYAGAWELSKTVLSLPIHPFLTDDEVTYVVAAIRKALA